MNTVEKKGIGKAKTGLVVSAVIIVILAVSNVWSYTNLQNQINTLNDEKNSLQSQVNTLQTDKTNLQSQIDSLNTTYHDYVSTHSHSNSEYDDLNSAYQNYMATHGYSNSEYEYLQGQLDSLNVTYQDYVANHTHSNSEYDSLNTAYQNYMATHSHSNSEYDALQSAYDNYVATHHHTDSEYDALEDERDAIKAPKLIKVNLRSDDNRPWLGTPYLHVYGYIVNVGTNTAYNCKLHIVAYQDGVVAIDTYILLGTIYGEGYASVDETLEYLGEALTSWSITLEWTA